MKKVLKFIPLLFSLTLAGCDLLDPTSMTGQNQQQQTDSGNQGQSSTTKQTADSHLVTFVDYNGRVISSQYVKDGEYPNYPADPYRKNSNGVGYNFIGWSLKYSPIKEDTVIVAMYEAYPLNDSADMCMALFFDYNGYLFDAQLVKNGSKPTAPTLGDWDNGWSKYIFKGWSPSVTEIWGTTYFYPIYDTITQEYTVNWRDYDGTILLTQTYRAGDWPNYFGDLPHRPSKDGVGYEFDHWEGIGSVYSDMDIYASYRETVATYRIRFFIDDEEEPYATQYVQHNMVPYVYGNPYKEGTEEVYYEFSGWGEELAPATEDKDYHGTFEAHSTLEYLKLALTPEKDAYRVLGFDPSLDPKPNHLGIPSEYNGLPIVEVAAQAFNGNNNIQTAYVSDSITTIGNYAFSSCWDTKFVMDFSKLKTIGESAFWNANRIQELDLSNAESIGERAFGACHGLKKVTLGDKLESFNINVFESCDVLTEFIISEDNQFLKIEDNFLLSKDGTKIFKHFQKEGVTSIEINEGVERIESFAFRNDPYIKEITFPESLQYIGTSVFDNCDQLTSIVIPDNVTTIEYNAFASCDKLESVTIGSGVKSLYGTFRYCTSLKSVTLSEGLESIWDGAFYGTKIQNIELPSTLTQLESAFQYVTGLTSVTIPANITSISWAFCYSSIETITFEEGFNSLGYGTLSNCRYLQTVILPSTLTYIGGEAFSYDSSLYEITFNGTVEQWNNVSKDYNWNSNSSLTKIICIDGTVDL